MASKTIESLLAEAVRDLQTDSAKLDAELLLACALNKNRSYLYAWPENPISTIELNKFNLLIKQRQQGLPISTITGTQEFWSLPFKVTKDTLIPRPETELLVQCCLDIGRSLSGTQKRTLRLIDLGTGSACIALAIASEEKSWHISACDISASALSVARENAINLKLEQVQFYQSNWLENIIDTNFDIIVSNPPYIAEDDPHLLDLQHEPAIALSSGVQGLDAIQAIGKTAIRKLNSTGVLLLEIGFEQSDAVRKLLSSLGYQSIQFQKDLAGHNRVCIARLAPH